jgi:hypothetical protein
MNLGGGTTKGWLGVGIAYNSKTILLGKVIGKNKVSIS